MKELTIQEKAEAYDEAVKVIKDNLDALNEITETGVEVVNIQSIKNCFYRAFPVLKENEDERIRKALIDYFDDVNKADENPLQSYGVHTDKAIAWLEKKGEIIDKEKVLIGARKDVALSITNYLDRNTLGICLSNMECADLESAVIDSDWSKVYDYMKKKLEKQGEKPQGKSAQEAINEKKVDNQNCIKPTNKVESKFEIKEGKWYVCIKDLLDSYANKAFYKGDTYLSTQDGSLMPSNSNVPFEVVCPDAYFRDWTIQDARDGNILAFDNNTIVMFKDLYNATTFHSYCHIEDGVFTASEKDVPDWWEGKGFHPATKEQRDTLMKAMDDAGFTFNFGKKELKELKKIEQKTTTWSEEDEDTIKFLISHFCVSHYNRSFQFPNKLITHDELLEKIRNLKPQNTWKPSDEQMEVLFKYSEQNNYDGSILTSLYQDLKKLK